MSDKYTPESFGFNPSSEAGQAIASSMETVKENVSAADFDGFVSDIEMARQEGTPPSKIAQEVNDWAVAVAKFQGNTKGI